MLFLQTIGEVPETVSPKLKVFAKKLKKSPGIPTLRRLPCVDLHEIMGVEEPEEPEEIAELEEQFEARDDYQKIWGWEFFYIPGLAYEARKRWVYRNAEGRHFDVLGAADYSVEEIVFMEDASCHGAFVEVPKLFPLVRSKTLRKVYDEWLGQFATFLFTVFGQPEDWADNDGLPSPQLDDEGLYYESQKLDLHRNIAVIAMEDLRPHPRHQCPCGSNTMYQECCQSAFQDYQATCCLELYTYAKEMRLARPDDEDYDFLDGLLEEYREAGLEGMLEAIQPDLSDLPDNLDLLKSIQKEPQ